MSNESNHPPTIKPIFIYTNQKIITVKECDKNDPYGIISRQAEQIACKTLRRNPTAYMLYIHFALHQEGYTFGLSPKNIENEIGLTKPQYDNAVKGLIKHGFLVKNKSYEYGYDFYTLPQTEIILPPPINAPMHTDTDTDSQLITPTSLSQVDSSSQQTTPMPPPQTGDTPPQSIGRNNTNNSTSDIIINTTENIIRDMTINTTEDITTPSDEEIDKYIDEHGFKKEYVDGILKIDDNFGKLTKEEFIETYFSSRTNFDDDSPF